MDCLWGHFCGQDGGAGARPDQHPRPLAADVDFRGSPDHLWGYFVDRVGALAPPCIHPIIHLPIRSPSFHPSTSSSCHPPDIDKLRGTMAQKSRCFSSCPCTMVPHPSSAVAHNCYKLENCMCHKFHRVWHLLHVCCCTAGLCICLCPAEFGLVHWR